MDVRQFVLLALQVSIVATVFGFGLNATPADLRSLFARPRLLLRSLLAVLVIMPIVALVLSQAFDVRPTAEIAILALAISPLPPVLPRKEFRFSGGRAYGLALMAVLAALAVVTVPLSAQLLETVVGKPFTASPMSIARAVMMSTVLPLFAGVAVRAMLPAIAHRIEPVVTLLARVLLPLAAVLLLAGTWRMIWEAIGGGAIVAMAVFAALGFLIGDLFGGPERGNATVLALACATRHPAIALSVASTNSPNEHYAGTILLYLLVNGVVGLAYLKWRQPARPAVPA
jgi:BASS family bile acid:Na+ symporter